MKLATFEGSNPPSVAFSPDGRILAAAVESKPGAASFSTSVHLWRVKSGSSISSIDFPFPGDRRSVTSLNFSLDNRLLAVASLAGTKGARIDVWDLKAHRHFASSPDRSDQRVRSVAFSADGRRILALITSGGDANDTQGIIETWTIGSGKPWIVRSRRSMGVMDFVAFSQMARPWRLWGLVPLPYGTQTPESGSARSKRRVSGIGQSPYYLAPRRQYLDRSIKPPQVDGTFGPASVFLYF